MEVALERLDPELLVLCAHDEEEPLEHVLDLLSDLPAGKLAIVDLDGITQLEIEALERAGVDAVLVREPLDESRVAAARSRSGLRSSSPAASCSGSRSRRVECSPRHFGNSLYVWGALIGVVLAACRPATGSEA